MKQLYPIFAENTSGGAALFLFDRPAPSPCKGAMILSDLTGESMIEDVCDMLKRMFVVLLTLALLAAPVSANAASVNTLRLSVSGSFETELARSMLDLINDLRTGSDAWYWNEDDTEKVTVTGLAAMRYD